MALGILFYVFLGMAFISILGIAGLYLVKNQNGRNVIFYVLGIWALVIAFMSSTALPSNYVVKRMGAWFIGFFGFAGMIIKYKNGEEKQCFAYGLVVASVTLGLSKMLFF